MDASVWVPIIAGVVITLLGSAFGVIWSELKAVRLNVHRLAGEMQRIATEVDLIMKRKPPR